MNTRILSAGLLFLFMMVAVSTCSTPAAAHEEPKKGERVIVYDKDHRRVGTIESNPNGKAFQTRNNQNQITGYIDGGKTYDSSHRRTGTLEHTGSFWK